MAFGTVPPEPHIFDRARDLIRRLERGPTSVGNAPSVEEAVNIIGALLLYNEENKNRELQILNLKHDLEMLGKALDEKDRRLNILYIRCAYLTNREYCDGCCLRPVCFVVNKRRDPEPGCDIVVERMKHQKVMVTNANPRAQIVGFDELKNELLTPNKLHKQLGILDEMK